MIFTFFATPPLYASNTFIHHELTVEVNPADHSIEAQDTITIPAERVTSEVHFLLHGDLSVVSKTENVAIIHKKDAPWPSDFGINQKEFFLQSDIPLKHYSVRIPEGRKGNFILSLTYKGTIHHPVKQLAKEYARGFSTTPGTISLEGIYLSGSTFWAPWFNNDLVTFSLTATLPATWDAVSQGQRTTHTLDGRKKKVRWESPEPMDEIFFVAAEFTEYLKKAGRVDVMAFLREQDEQLADKYLETTEQYLSMYQKLIGPFPYKKFALVENFWETGYGMPSFTLLGPKIIRFPFILHSSYPHELLHNWWGNGVFVDYEKGNWCEGLTAYLADHLIKEQRGQGAEYRQTTLQKYRDYVNKNSDFPLTAFRSRHSASTEAVGYGKTMFLWHMLRLEVGDDLFIQTMQRFYKDNIFKRAAFGDIRRSVEEVTKKNMKSFFDQWVTRTGAPDLRLANAASVKKNNKFLLSFVLSQTQPGTPYHLTVPVAIHLEEGEEAVLKMVKMTERDQNYEFILASRPLRVDIDPQYDIFRLLHRNEIPPALSQAFGAEKVLIVLPSVSEPDILNGYQQLAQNWAQEKTGMIEVVTDRDITSIPGDRAVWLFGWENAHRGIITELISHYDAGLNTETIRINKTVLSAQRTSIVISARNPENPDAVLVLLSSDRAAAIPGLGRKLPHYGKYSYLAFEGDEPTNILKGRWPAVNSPNRSVVLHSDGSQPKIIEKKIPSRSALAYIVK